MKSSILITAPTPGEIAPMLRKFNLEEHYGYQHFELDKLNIKLLITGAGIAATTFHLARKLTPDINAAIQCGIAGSYNADFKNGDLCRVKEDSFRDFGLWHKDGFNSFADKPFGFIERFPFREGVLYDDFPELPPVPKIRAGIGATVNSIRYGNLTNDMYKTGKQADIESMEGAAFFYTAAMMQIPRLQIRAVSNPAGSRRSTEWDIPMAVEKLSTYMIRLLKFCDETGYFRTFEASENS